jgi:hypothetical protein
LAIFFAPTKLELFEQYHTKNVSDSIPKSLLFV